MDYKLIAIDMDGTLLNRKQKISTENKKIIDQALSNGIKIVLCSGRAYSGLRDSAAELGLDQMGSDQFLVEFGGSIVQDFNQRIYYRKILRNEDCEQVADYLNEQKINFHLIDDQGSLYDSYQDWIEKRMIDTNLGIVKFLLKTHKHELLKMAQKLHSKYDANYEIVRTSERELELFPKNVNKGNALIYLTKLLNIDLKQVMAIGDYDNDLPMLKIVGLSVAMQNATAEVKSVSDVETLDNDHDGVGAAIQKYAL